MTEKIYISYDQIKEYSKKVAQEIEKDSHTEPNIITFTRGGLFAAGFISNYLSYKPNVISIGESNYYWIARCINSSGGYIVLDEILETGETLLKFSELYYLEPYKKYFLIDKPLNRSYTCEYYAAEKIETDKWIVFPWEIDNEKN